MFLDLMPAASIQGGLFEASDSAARQRLMKMIDRLNARHGRDTISFARSGRQRAWKRAASQRAPLAALHDELGRVAAGGLLSRH